MANVTQAPPKGPQGPQGSSTGPSGQGGQAPTGTAAAGPGVEGLPAPVKRIGKFRVTSSDHVDDQLAWLPRSKVLEWAAKAGIENAASLSDDGRGGLSPLRQAVRATRVAERRWKTGAIVASPRPLSSRWPEKFFRVGDDIPESPGESTLKAAEPDVEESYTEQGAQQAWEAEHNTDGLHLMDPRQLRELAYQEGIDLGNAGDKASILATIRRARKAAAEDR